MGFVSVSEPNLDYSTPQGFLFLSMLGALAEWYSRNLAAETRKGWAERKQAGLYAGRLPFGAMKGDDGVPAADTRPLDLDGRATTNQNRPVLKARFTASRPATPIGVPSSEVHTRMKFVSRWVMILSHSGVTSCLPSPKSSHW